MTCTQNLCNSKSFYSAKFYACYSNFDRKNTFICPPGGFKCYYKENVNVMDLKKSF